MAKRIFHFYPSHLRICTRIGMRVPLKAMPCLHDLASCWSRKEHMEEMCYILWLFLIDLQIRTFFVNLFFSLRAKAIKEDSSMSNRGNWRKALWLGNVCIYNSWCVICSLGLWTQSQWISGFIKLSTAFPFWTHVELQGNFLQTALSQSRMAAHRMCSPWLGASTVGMWYCDGRGCLMGLGFARHQNQCTDTQAYGLSAEISRK